MPLDDASGARRLRLLADIVAASSVSDAWQQRAQRLRDAAAALQADGSARGAEIARDSFMLAAEAIAALPGVAAPRREVDSLRAAAQAIDPREALRSQRERVDRFFGQAAAAMPAPSRARVPARRIRG